LSIDYGAHALSDLGWTLKSALLLLSFKVCKGLIECWCFSMDALASFDVESLREKCDIGLSLFELNWFPRVKVY